MPTLQELDRVWTTWQTSPHFQHAVAATCAEHHYAVRDIEHQLRLVADRCSSASLIACAQAEGLGVGELAHYSRPRRVLHLVASTVPGLSVESLCHTLALGAPAVVRPSRRETVLPAWMDHLRDIRSPLHDRIDVISDALPTNVDAAVVFGSDATIDVVRQHLLESNPHGVPIAGYGSRHGIAVIDAATAAHTDTWLPALADDIAMFAQRGCMSPRHLIVIGELSSAERTTLRDELHTALRAAWDRHVADTAHSAIAVQARRVSDAGTLDALFGDSASDAIRHELLHVDIHWVPHDDGARSQLDQFASELQTAVLVAASDARVAVLDHLVRAAGCTRTCAPGHAHEPAADWPHDGIGWFTPLLAR